MATPPVFQRFFCSPEVKAVNDKTREVTHLISTASIDRAGDVVEPTGADVSNYMRNPVVLADHDYSIHSIIGRAKSLGIEKDGITAVTEFGDHELGRHAFGLVKAGMARAWSIGFKPTQHESLKDEKGIFKGFHFLKWELLEYSLVAIPANPDAVMSMVQRGVISTRTANTIYRTVYATAPPEAEASAPNSANVAEQRGQGHHYQTRLQAMLDRARRIERAQRYLARKKDASHE